MTGDRMINLAKTPANVDFQSKYYKQPLTDRTARPLDTTFESLETPPAPPSLPASPVEGSSQNDLINQRPAVSISYCYTWILSQPNLNHSSAEKGLHE